MVASGVYLVTFLENKKEVSHLHWEFSVDLLGCYRAVVERQEPKSNASGRDSHDGEVKRDHPNKTSVANGEVSQWQHNQQ